MGLMAIFTVKYLTILVAFVSTSLNYKDKLRQSSQKQKKKWPNLTYMTYVNVDIYLSEQRTLHPRSD